MGVLSRGLGWVSDKGSRNMEGFVDHVRLVVCPRGFEDSLDTKIEGRIRIPIEHGRDPK